MKKYIFLLFLFPLAASAIDCESYSPFNFYPAPNKLPLCFSLNKSEIIKGPKWDTKSEPQLSISQVVEIASKSINELNLKFNVKLSGVSLKQFGCKAPEYFYYDVVFNTSDNKDRMLGEYHLIIYQNSVVNLPLEVEQPKLPW